jgi:hypothetical protein
VVVRLVHRARAPDSCSPCADGEQGRGGSVLKQRAVRGAVPASGVILRWGRSAQGQPARAPTVRWGSPYIPALGARSDAKGLLIRKRRTKCLMPRFGTVAARQ